MVTTVIALSLLPSLPSGRTDLPLSRDWQYVVQRPISLKAPSEGWVPTLVPHTEYQESSAPGSAVWFRRTVQVALRPKDRAFLDFRAALYSPQVFVDGEKVDAWVGGWYPHQVEITRWVADGKAHQVTVRCQDRTATYADGFQVTRTTSALDQVGKTIMPAGGYKETTGLWLPVQLLIRPAQFLSDSELCIEPSVRKKQLALSGQVIGSNDGTIDLTLIDRGGKRTALGSTKVKGSRWSFVTPMKTAKLWSPESPYLYTLEATLRGADRKAVDVQRTRFGFREMWTQGPDFYLNGVKRHLLASSAWPIQEWLQPEIVRSRLRDLKNIGAMTYRLHIGLWQEDFARIADEEGVLIIPEMPVYTDGSGMYGYKDPRFWANYRDVVQGLIKRDRNHASVVMWSLGNEILFMGNQKYDANLPKKLGDMARFAKTIDSTRPYTYEADLDPDGAFDVIGLHYPHELPFQSAYPVICDWLAEGKLTEAAGGMLGQTRSSFKWARKKPLYIGEYLWVPLGDYSPGSVFFGPDAYRNRSEYIEKGRARSWIDQTIAYRRAGVSGLSPWAATDFGMAKAGEVPRQASAFALKKVAVYLQNKAVRAYVGKPMDLRLDVFNDSDRDRKLELTIRYGKQLIKQPCPLPAGGYSLQKVSLSAQAGPGTLMISLSEGKQVFDQIKKVVETSPVHALQVPAGWTLYEGTLAPTSDPIKTVWIVPEHALDPEIPAEAKKMPTIGAGSFDATAFREFLNQGGRAVVLAQNDLGSLGLSARLVDHLSTMQFPISAALPVSSELSFWGKSMVVAQRQIERTGVGGMRSLSVTGGLNSLAQSPIAWRTAGNGVVALVQARVEASRADDPAVQATLQDTIDFIVRAEPARQGPVVVLGDDKLLQGLHLRTSKDLSTLSSSGGLVLVGDAANAEAVRGALKAGVPILWIQPSVAKFNELRGELGADQLKAVTAQNGAYFTPGSPLTEGITREETDLHSAPRGWDRIIEPLLGVCPVAIVPEGTSQEVVSIAGNAFSSSFAFRTPTALRIKRRDTLKTSFTVSQAGWYELAPKAQLIIGTGALPSVEVTVDGERVDWAPADVPSRVYLQAGKHQLGLWLYDMGEWGDSRMVEFQSLSIRHCPDYPQGVDVPIAPGSLVSWQNGNSTVVIDTIAGHGRSECKVQGSRFLGALLGNLRFPFEVESRASGFVVGTGHLKVESGGYNTASDASLEMRSGGSAATSFYCLGEGDFDFIAEASSTPFKGEYSQFEIEIDGKVWGTVQCTGPNQQVYRAGSGHLAKGVHTLRVRFTNDAGDSNEDRNLWIHRMTFQPSDRR